MESNLLLAGKTQFAAPTPADNDAIPLSMTSAGRVRVDAVGTVTATISGTPAVTISGTPAVTATISGTPAVTISGTPAVTATISGTPAVTATISGTPAVTISGTPAVTATPATGTAYALSTAASTNTGFIKASAGSLFEMSVFNVTGATVYVKIYNKASAPTLASDVPVFTIPVAAGAFSNFSFGHLGKRFSTGMAIAVTGAAAHTDTTAVGAGALVSATYL